MEQAPVRGTGADVSVCALPSVIARDGITVAVLSTAARLQTVDVERVALVFADTHELVAPSERGAAPSCRQDAGDVLTAQHLRGTARAVVRFQVHVLSRAHQDRAFCLEIGVRLAHSDERVTVHSGPFVVRSRSAGKATHAVTSRASRSTASPRHRGAVRAVTPAPPHHSLGAQRLDAPAPPVDAYEPEDGDEGAALLSQLAPVACAHAGAGEYLSGASARPPGDSVSVLARSVSAIAARCTDPRPSFAQQTETGSGSEQSAAQRRRVEADDEQQQLASGPHGGGANVALALRIASQRLESRASADVPLPQVSEMQEQQQEEQEQQEHQHHQQQHPPPPRPLVPRHADELAAAAHQLHALADDGMLDDPFGLEDEPW